MNLDRINDRLRTIVVILGGLLFAAFCGMQAGSGNFQRLGLVFTIFAVIAICLMLRERLWILVPFGWGFTGKLVALPVPVMLRDLIVIVIFVAYVAFRALKVVRTRPSFGVLEGLVLANLLYVATMFIRNPVGAKAFGSEMVGGRPYWDIAIAALGGWVLASAPPDRKNLLRVPLYFLLGTSIQAGAELLGMVAGGLAGFLSDFYSSFAPVVDNPLPSFDEGAVDPAYVRLVPLGAVGFLGVLALCSYYRPLSLLQHPLRLIALGAFMVGILLSGFRTLVLRAVVTMGVSTIFRRRIRDLVILCTIGFLLLIVVIAGNGRLFNLPLTAQRALSFLPGKWDADAMLDAKGSAQWRYDMWEMVIKEDKWIQNKWLGDGFGFTRHELGIMESMSRGGPGFLGGAQQELFMIVGSFHNGPLSAVRYGGVVGLVLLLALMILSGRRAIALIRQSYDTALFPAALFMAIPLVYAPLEFTFIFGGYDGSLPLAILMAGYLGMFRRNFDEELSSSRRENLPDLEPRSTERSRAEEATGVSAKVLGSR